MDQYEDASLKTLGSIIPFAILAFIAVILRFYARRLVRAEWARDDWTSLLALFPTLGCFILSCLMVKYGSGKHVRVVSPANFEPYLQCLFAYELIYAHAILFIKTSVLMLYTRIFSTRKFKLVVMVVQAVIVAWYLAVVFVSIFSCNPTRGFWDKTLVPPAKCVSSKKFFVGNAIPNIVTDVVILALPINTVFGLQLRTTQKLSICFTFLLGIFVTVSSAVRLVAQFRVDEPDFTWAMNDTVIWTSIEPSLGLICACLPTMRPLLNSFTQASEKRSRRTTSYALSERSNPPQGSITRNGRGTWPLQTTESRSDLGRSETRSKIVVDTRIDIESSTEDTRQILHRVV
ncbi:hypothetical protein EJ05DRAFT_456834 [Pseudovirgaria hyperparasitica]|uniref:Rhodopsin domain-containing protein n=1 Tax=Pseudovirgaria hyperparasitica TaxID=470096 RepID=A0A6A6VVN6_9PEZI|nr:uncharacterized protein EJ05DRAFT_456834 [Pseudovirgaria hyperparasitica]KAF2754642.1 hypothetical protein EJ05DRAFT_456834 [Pseudovirgaria hyperparasitica]